MEWPGRQMVTCRRPSSGHVASIDERLLANCHKLHLKVTKKMMTMMILNALLWYTHTYLESYSRAETKSCTFSRVNQRLDYGNSMLVGIPAYLTCRLQSVLNAAARLVFHLRRSDHVTNALVSLQWLRVPERIQFKIAVLTYSDIKRPQVLSCITVPGAVYLYCWGPWGTAFCRNQSAGCDYS